MTGTGPDRSLHEYGPVVRTLRSPAFELKEVRSPVDFADHDRRVQELVRKAAEESRTQTFALAPPVAGIVEMTLVPGEFGEDLLADARANIAERAYEVALEQLDEFLELSPMHQEARYLRAFCLYQTDESRFEEALRVLGELRCEQLPGELVEQVQALRRELRRRLTPLHINAYAEQARRNPRAALTRAEGYLELVPEEGALSCLVALGWARFGDLPRALECAERGAEAADGDRQQVAGLAKALRVAVLGELAEPAVALLKLRDYDGARMELALLEPRWRRSTVIKDFDDYLLSLRGLARGSRPPAPRLPPDRAEDLYSLIAESDTHRGLQLIGAGRLADAEALLGALMLLVPRFPWLNFVYALCLYRLERSPDTARECAETALLDRTITQAPELLAAIRDWQEAEIVNPLVDEFIEVMESVRGTASADRLTVLRTRLVTLERRVPHVSGSVRSAAGKAMVRELAQLIRAKIAEVDEVALLDGLYTKFAELIDSLGDRPIASAQQLERFATDLDLLALRVQTARTRVRSAQGIKELDELARRVKTNQEQAARGRTGFAVDDLARRFERLAQQLHSPGAALRLQTELRRLLQDAARLRGSGAVDERGRATLDQLIGILTRIVR